jgi:hypothetical protein
MTEAEWLACTSPIELLAALKKCARGYQSWRVTGCLPSTAVRRPHA